MNFCTQRLTQPVSREMRDLVVKSSMHESKQRSTRPENICVEDVSTCIGDERYLVVVVVVGFGCDDPADGGLGNQGDGVDVRS